MLLEYLFKPQSPFSASWVSRSFSHDHFKGTLEIAFLFLARLNLPLDFIWGAFFKVWISYFILVCFFYDKKREKKIGSNQDKEFMNIGIKKIKFNKTIFF